MYAAEECAIRRNAEKNRFELTVAGITAFVDYVQMGKRILYTHTEVPKGLAGQGVGTRLARHVLDYARKNDLRVIPLCPFIASYIRSHPEYRDLALMGFAI